MLARHRLSDHNLYLPYHLPEVQRSPWTLDIAASVGATAVATLLASGVVSTIDAVSNGSLLLGLPLAHAPIATTRHDATPLSSGEVGSQALDLATDRVSPSEVHPGLFGMSDEATYVADAAETAEALGTKALEQPDRVERLNGIMRQYTDGATVRSVDVHQDRVVLDAAQLSDLLEMTYLHHLSTIGQLAARFNTAPQEFSPSETAKLTQLLVNNPNTTVSMVINDNTGAQYRVSLYNYSYQGEAATPSDYAVYIEHDEAATATTLPLDVLPLPIPIPRHRAAGGVADRPRRRSSRSQPAHRADPSKEREGDPSLLDGLSARRSVASHERAQPFSEAVGKFIGTVLYKSEFDLQRAENEAYVRAKYPDVVPRRPEMHDVVPLTAEAEVPAPEARHMSERIDKSAAIEMPRKKHWLLKRLGKIGLGLSGAIVAGVALFHGAASSAPHPQPAVGDRIAPFIPPSAAPARSGVQYLDYENGQLKTDLQAGTLDDPLVVVPRAQAPVAPHVAAERVMTPAPRTEESPAWQIQPGMGGYALMQQAGYPLATWDAIGGQLLQDHPEAFYLMPDGEVGLSHPGQLSAAVIQDILHLAQR